MKKEINCHGYLCWTWEPGEVEIPACSIRVGDKKILLGQEVTVTNVSPITPVSGPIGCLLPHNPPPKPKWFEFKDFLVTFSPLIDWGGCYMTDHITASQWMIEGIEDPNYFKPLHDALDKLDDYEVCNIVHNI